jgi:hypothetical protein
LEIDFFRESDPSVLPGTVALRSTVSLANCIPEVGTPFVFLPSTNPTTVVWGLDQNTKCSANVGDQMRILKPGSYRAKARTTGSAMWSGLSQFFSIQR